MTDVLLADGWHKVRPETFDTDAYEYLDGHDVQVYGGTVPGVPSTGFCFEDEDGSEIVGPLTSILAIRRTATS
ncbi:hypothetical protein [Rhodococcus erythropolis]